MKLNPGGVGGPSKIKSQGDPKFLQFPTPLNSDESTFVCLPKFFLGGGEIAQLLASLLSGWSGLAPGPICLSQEGEILSLCY